MKNWEPNQNQLIQLLGNTLEQRKSRKNIKNWWNRGVAWRNISATHQKEVLPGDSSYTIGCRIEYRFRINSLNCPAILHNWEKVEKRSTNWSNRDAAWRNISTTDQKELLSGDILYTIRCRIEYWFGIRSRICPAILYKRQNPPKKLKTDQKAVPLEETSSLPTKRGYCWYFKVW